ncbi:hypothetical protein [Enterovibrio norvegicus]|uniref:hypothetical protein n=1 Tax=Enterovibrio norvegicus TaxID=188144 RepID=UPI0024B062ED|nr:hypothetical protein [Enterovibrio norvegicus]
MKYLSLIIAFASLFFSSHSISAISYDNKIGWIAVSSSSSNQGHFVEFENHLEGVNDCREDTNHNPRILFSKDDNDILSLLLMAKSSNSRVGFYYSTSSSIPKTAGHGLVECEFINIWIK